MAKICPICNDKIKVKMTVMDGIICSSCAGISSNFRTENIEDIKRFWNENQLRASRFSKKSILKGFMTDVIVIDGESKLLYFGKENEKFIHHYYSFDEISEYNFEQVGGKTITKTKGGVGRAVVGGVLFGGVGAVVGASTSKKETKTIGGTNLLKITLDTHSGKIVKVLTNPPNGLIPFLDKCIDESQENSSSLKMDDADEIIKFKSLLDQGIITQDEFEAKKKQILSI